MVVDLAAGGAAPGAYLLTAAGLEPGAVSAGRGRLRTAERDRCPDRLTTMASSDIPLTTCRLE